MASLDFPLWKPPNYQAYPPFILATAAAAMDMECMLFFTFWGLDIIH
ncbi:MAG: DsrE/DsrF/DrsH-like family protein, partial [Firmicutes bacterium]|nr:DsrE/DsrF/DrsH-like family protein [Bacillota bacterium]